MEARKFWEGMEKIPVLQLLDKFLIGRNATGQTMYADINQIRVLLAAFLTGQLIPQVVQPGSTIGKPEDATLLYVGPGTYTVSTSPAESITTTANLSILLWDKSSWSKLEIPVDVDLSNVPTFSQVYTKNQTYNQSEIDLMVIGLTADPSQLINIFQSKIDKDSIGENDGVAIKKPFFNDFKNGSKAPTAGINTLVVSDKSGVEISLRETTIKPNGQAITDNDVDEFLIFKKTDGRYFYRNLPTSEINLEQSGLLLHGSDSGEYNTAIAQRIIDNAPDGVKISFPGGGYDLKGLKPRCNLKYRGNGTKVYQSERKPGFDIVGRWGDIKQVSSIQAVNVVKNGVVRSVNRVNVNSTAGIYVDDVIRIYSNDGLPDVPFAGRKCGEFATVAEVGSNYLILNAILRDEKLYTDNIRLSVIVGDTVDIRGFEFIVNPNIAGSGNWGGGGGSECFIRLSSLKNPIVKDVIVRNSASNAVVFHSCFGYLADNVQAINLPDQPDLYDKYGYGITDANSEYGKVINAFFQNCRHGFTTNTYPSITGAEPSGYGRSAYFRVINSHSISGYSSGFDCHDGAVYGKIIGCTHTFSNYRVQPNNVGSGGSAGSFNIRGSHMELIDCDSIGGFNGFTVQTSTGLNGGDVESNWVKDVKLINCNCDSQSTGLTIDKSEVTVIGGNIRKNKDYPQGQNAIIRATDSKVTFFNTTMEESSDILQMIVLRNSSITLDKCKVINNTAIKDANGRVVNYQMAIVLIPESKPGDQVIIRDLEIVSGEVPIGSIVRNGAANTTNVKCFIDGVFHKRKSGTVVLANENSTVVEAGSITDPEGPIRLLDHTVAGIKNRLSFIEDTGSIIDHSFISPTSSNVTTAMRRVADNVITLNMGSFTTPVGMGGIVAGKFDGQELVIINNNASVTVSISPGIQNVDIPRRLVITPKEQIRLKWYGNSWKYSNTIIPKMVKVTVSGDGTKTSFTFAHGLGSEPAFVGFPNARNQASADAGISWVNTSGTTLTLYTKNPLIAGTDNGVWDIYVSF